MKYVLKVLCRILGCVRKSNIYPLRWEVHLIYKQILCYNNRNALIIKCEYVT